MHTFCSLNLSPKVCRCSFCSASRRRASLRRLRVACMQKIHTSKMTHTRNTPSETLMNAKQSAPLTRNDKAAHCLTLEPTQPFALSFSADQKPAQSATEMGSSLARRQSECAINKQLGSSPACLPLSSNFKCSALRAITQIVAGARKHAKKVANRALICWRGKLHELTL